MDQVFECVYGDARHVGVTPAAGAGTDRLELYPVGSRGLLGVLAEGGFATGDLRTRLATLATTGPVIADREELVFLPPLLPEHKGNALISGFGLSHTVKMPPNATVGGIADGAYPSWFFKGQGWCLKTIGQSLRIPNNAVRVTEEAEVVLIFVTDGTGAPHYIGFTFGNDVTDMGQIKRNPAHLSYAKLCDCAIAPTLFLAVPPREVDGRAAIVRAGETLWEAGFKTGTTALFHPIEQTMEHLWSNPATRVPGITHYVFLGADRNSFDAGVQVLDGDRMDLIFDSHGVALSNPITRFSAPPAPIGQAPAAG